MSMKKPRENGKVILSALRDWQRYLLTALACTATTLITTPLLGHLDLANIVMLFLLTVLIRH